MHNPSRLVPLPTGGRSVKPCTVLRSIIDTHAEDVSSPKPPSKSESILYRFWHETKDYLLQFKNAGLRETFQEDIKYIFASAYNNIREGDAGKRGEELFAIQAVVVTSIIHFLRISLKSVDYTSQIHSKISLICHSYVCVVRTRTDSTLKKIKL